MRSSSRGPNHKRPFEADATEIDKIPIKAPAVLSLLTTDQLNIPQKAARVQSPEGKKCCHPDDATPGGANPKRARYVKNLKDPSCGIPLAPSTQNNQTSIFLGSAISFSTIYSRYLTPKLAEMMWQHAQIICNSMYSRISSVRALQPPRRQAYLQPTGCLVTDWFRHVSTLCPAIFDLPNEAIFQHPCINQVNLLRAINDNESTLPSVAENTLVKTARFFREARQPGQTAASHAIYEAIVYAACPHEYSRIYRQISTCLDELHAKVNSITEVYALLSDQSRRARIKTESAQYSFGPLSCFLLAGLRGLFFGPTHSRACTPVGAALLLHCAITASEESLFIKEPIWTRTELLITSKMCGMVESPSCDHTISKGNLAQALAQDFLSLW